MSVFFWSASRRERLRNAEMDRDYFRARAVVAETSVAVLKDRVRELTQPRHSDGRFAPKPRHRSAVVDPKVTVGLAADARTYAEEWGSPNYDPAMDDTRTES